MQRCPVEMGAAPRKLIARFHMKHLVIPLLALLSMQVASAAELTEAECHSSRDEEFLADCIEHRIPNACEALSGGPSSFLVSRCVRAQREIAERRIRRATEAIESIVTRLPIKKRGFVNDDGELERPRGHLAEGNIVWQKFVMEECWFRNELDDVSAPGGEALGYCEVRLMNERVEVLETLLSELQSAPTVEE